MSCWRVEKKVHNRWRFVGVKETNYPYASNWWAALGRRWGNVYRLVEES